MASDGEFGMSVLTIVIKFGTSAREYVLLHDDVAK